MSPLHPVQILDSTLREGEQAAAVRFTVEQKLELASRLDAFGVDFIEAGHPVVSDAVREAVSAIQCLGLRASVLGHARASRTDIEAVARCGVRWVGIFCGVNRYTLVCKLRVGKDAALARIADAVRFAKSLGLQVRYSCEDASRTELVDLLEVYHRAIDAGADRISVVDTVGVLTPQRTADLVRRVKSACPVPVHVHCHNDLGMGAANALTALEAGASVVDVTVNGLGERSGIAALAEVTTALKVLHEVPNSWRMEDLPGLSRLVARYARVRMGRYQPVVGRFAFAHKAGLHTAAVLRDPASYEPLDPAAVGARRRVIADEFAGRTTLRHLLERSGREHDGPAVERALNELKNGDAGASPRRRVAQATGRQ